MRGREHLKKGERRSGDMSSELQGDGVDLKESVLTVCQRGIKSPFMSCL